MLLTVLADALEVRVGFHADLLRVATEHLFLFADADAHGVFEDQPDDAGGDQDEDAGGDNADQLGDEAGVRVGDRNRQGAPDTADQVDRQGADNVIDLELVKERNRQNTEDTANGADQGRST